jgi:hypothetical protein
VVSGFAAYLPDIVLVNHSPYDDDALIYQFKYYDQEYKTSLGGRTTIITVEFAKVEKLVEKSVDGKVL